MLAVTSGFLSWARNPPHSEPPLATCRAAQRQTEGQAPRTSHMMCSEARVARGAGARCSHLVPPAGQAAGEQRRALTGQPDFGQFQQPRPALAAVPMRAGARRFSARSSRVQRSTSKSTVPAPLEKQPDQQRIVATLSAESHVPIDVVAALYEGERAGLAVGAHITKFLHIFAIRNVQEILRKRALDTRPLQPVGPPLLRA